MNLKSVLQDINRQIAELQKARNVLLSLSGSGSSKRGTRTMSAAGRRRISLAQKKRWAKLRLVKK